MPSGSLIALLGRVGRQIIPHGSTRLEEDDRPIIIGDPAGIRELSRRQGDGRS
jgi:Trk K+ transport system NAD-binding subunit